MARSSTNCLISYQIIANHSLRVTDSKNKYLDFEFWFNVANKLLAHFATSVGSSSKEL